MANAYICGQGISLPRICQLNHSNGYIQMHYWRVPVPELWIDILQKVKVAGYACVAGRVVRHVALALARSRT
jgi:hypothetical protein